MGAIMSASSEALVTWWKCRYEHGDVVAVQGPEESCLLHCLLRDSDGDVVLVTTHFLSEEAAWLQLIAECRAAVREADREFMHARDQLNNAVESEHRARVALNIAHHNHARRESERKGEKT
jgi:hypothetical protein